MNPESEPVIPHQESLPLGETGHSRWHRVTASSVWVAALAAASMPWQATLHAPARWPVAFALIAYAGTTGLLIRRHQHLVAQRVFLWGLAVALLALGALAPSVSTGALVLLPIVVMQAGWTLGTRHAYAMGLASLLGITSVPASAWLAGRGAPDLAAWAGAGLATLAASLLGGEFAQVRSRLAHRTAAAEQAQVRALAERTAAQESFSTLFRSTPIPVSLTCVKDGTYRDVNPAWERISGWPRNEVVGRTSLAIGIWVAESDRSAWIAELAERGRIDNHLIRFRVRNGEVREFLSSGEPITVEGEACVFASFMDVTDQRAADARLRELNAELEARVLHRTQLLEDANATLNETVHLLRHTQDELVRAETLASLGALVAGIAHELNTPLGSSVLIASTLRERLISLQRELAGGALRKSALSQFVSDADEACALLASSLQRARDLVASFKTVATDQASARRRTFDLAELIEDVIQTLRPGFKQQPIEVDTALTPGVQMDSLPGPICQVVTNLIQNAVLHGLDPTTGGTLRIACRALDDVRVGIEVSDNGRGIPAEHLSRIFDPFFTTRLGAGGSGLGLSIVHSLVTGTLGGAISVESCPGQGSRFSLILPRQAPPDNCDA